MPSLTAHPGTTPPSDPSGSAGGEPGRRLVAAGWIVHRRDPLNCETSLRALIDGLLTPSPGFYVRNHFATPVLDR